MDRLLCVGTVFAVVGVAIQTVIHLLNAALDGGPFLSVGGENNPIAWSHSAAIFAAAFVCALHAATVSERRRIFAALAAILAFLSLDEILIVHERIVSRVLEVLGLPIVWDSVLWPLLYLPLLGALLLLLVRVAREASKEVGLRVLVGLGLLVAAVGAEVVSAPLSTGENWPHTVEGGFEEGAELAGWILITTGLTALTLERFLASLHVDAGQQPIARPRR
jgi:hypothetical protein